MPLRKLSDGRADAPRKRRQVRRVVPVAPRAAFEREIASDSSTDDDDSSDSDDDFVVPDEPDPLYDARAVEKSRLKWGPGPDDRFGAFLEWVIGVVVSADDAVIQPMHSSVLAIAAAPLRLAETMVDGTWNRSTFYVAVCTMPYATHYEVHHKARGPYLMESEEERELCQVCHTSLEHADEERYMQLWGPPGYQRDDFCDPKRARDACKRMLSYSLGEDRGHVVALHLYCAQRAYAIHCGMHWVSQLMCLVRNDMEDSGHRHVSREFRVRARHRYDILIDALQNRMRRSEEHWTSEHKLMFGTTDPTTPHILPACYRAPNPWL